MGVRACPAPFLQFAALKIGVAFLNRFSSKNDFLGLVSLISNQTRYIDPSVFPMSKQNDNH